MAIKTGATAEAGSSSGGSSAGGGSGRCCVGSLSCLEVQAADLCQGNVPLQPRLHQLSAQCAYFAWYPAVSARNERGGVLAASTAAAAVHAARCSQEHAAAMAVALAGAAKAAAPAQVDCCCCKAHQCANKQSECHETRPRAVLSRWRHVGRGLAVAATLQKRSSGSSCVLAWLADPKSDAS